jgi:RsiW-degrading membrane proteinase PrsW (M82 family)
MEDKPQQQCVIPLHKPSLRELIFFFSSGILVSIPFALFFANLYPFFPAALAVILVAPLIEELAKVFPLFYRHGETERSLVTLGILTGLGFGISELVIYVALLNVPLIARIPGVIFHASSAAITAYGIAKKNNFFAVEAAVNFGLLAELLVLITVYLLAWRFYHQASKEKMVV